MEQKLTFALFGNSFQISKSAHAADIVRTITRRGGRVVVDRPFYDFLASEGSLPTDIAGTFDGDRFEADYAVSIGGDGTFLKAAMRVGRKITPLIGINVGRLGFLAGVLPGDIEAAFDDIFAHRYTIEEHTAIELTTDGAADIACPYALNDIAVLKRDVASMISIRTSINGEYLATYQADGLIVCTPTGSTAYSLSNGGPIIVPQTGTLCLTPVAPHSLNTRPIIVADDSEVALTVTSRSHNFLVAIDGRSVTLPDGVGVSIRKAPFTTRIIKRGNQTYFSSLREKMMWGADKRRE